MAFGDNIQLGNRRNPQSLNQAAAGGLDLTKSSGRRGLFAPAQTFGALFQSPEAQGFLNQEGIARGLLQESLRAGTQNIGRQSNEFAARQGLGPGFAAQQTQDAEQELSNQIAQGVSAARLGDLRNRFMAASTIADALVTAQRASFTRNLQRRAAQPNFGQMALGAFSSNFGASAGSTLGQGAAAALLAI